MHILIVLTGKWETKSLMSLEISSVLRKIRKLSNSKIKPYTSNKRKVANKNQHQLYIKLIITWIDENQVNDVLTEETVNWINKAKDPESNIKQKDFVWHLMRLCLLARQRKFIWRHVFYFLLGYLPALMDLKWLLWEV